MTQEIDAEAFKRLTMEIGRSVRVYLSGELVSTGEPEVMRIYTALNALAAIAGLILAGTGRDEVATEWFFNSVNANAASAAELEGNKPRVAS